MASDGENVTDGGGLMTESAEPIQIDGGQFLIRHRGDGMGNSDWLVTRPEGNRSGR